LVLRFLSNRGPGRPLATNDALPKAVANDPEIQEAWITTWERVLHAMPQEYAVYRRVAMNVQNSPRVFLAWLQAVRPLNRPREEEEAWRTFLLLHSGGGFPPVLPRLEIFERNPKLRSMLRDALQNDSARSGTPSSKEANDFITRGMRSLFRKSKSLTACHAAQPLADVELLQKAFPLASADAQAEGRTRRVDAADYALLREASEVLRASPWLLEWLPPETAWNPTFHKAVLAGWKAYLGVAPWLLPWIPAASRRHFHKTRSGIQIIEQPSAQRPREPLHAAA
jgi:hypothetical protein